MGKTLFEKIWDNHIAMKLDDNQEVLYIDQHLIHEVTSPQAFEGIKKRNINVFRPKQIVATVDHNVPTVNQQNITDALSKNQIDTLKKNCADSGIELYGIGHPYQGIVHVIGPELGITKPGMTIVCGDSHTSTHGAFGAIAFGIGTTQIEQVFASQCVIIERPKTMRINIEGNLHKFVTAKDIILFIISKIGTNGATGYFVEYAGSTIRSLSMEGRMTICNMSIEMGARGGMIGPDETTYTYLKGRPFTPKEKYEDICKKWNQLNTDADAKFDKEISYSAAEITPMVTFGTSPETGISIGDKIPANGFASAKLSDYMGFHNGEYLLNKKIDYVFIGSCTNSRIEDLRAAAQTVKGRKKAAHVHVWVVPGSRQVMQQAQKEGLDKIFIEAGFEFREPGCSACLAMNSDKIPAGALCVSTSNRNFEGRQGPGSRTILASPLTAVVSAIAGTLQDPRTYLS
ncbi:MAG: 3-isopropylmalate dehydratase large subunit [Bacteroidia bacterium]